MPEIQLSEIGNNPSLVDYLKNYISSVDLSEPTEVKPDEFVFSKNTKKPALEIVQKDYSTNIDKQIQIIATNIAMKFFDLSEQKFEAVLQRINLWGYDILLQEFILNYYVIIKNDNRLRYFILLYLEKIIKATQDIIKKELITNMDLFDHTNVKTGDLVELTHKLAKKEEELLALKPEQLNIDNSTEIFSSDKIKLLKTEILKDLKEKNADLEELTFI